MQNNLRLLPTKGSYESPHKDDSKERAHSAFTSMEDKHRKKSLYLLGILGGSAIAGAGLAKKNKLIAGAGISSAFLSGIMRGKAKREESVSKHKIRKHLGIEKAAVLGSIIHGITHVVAPEIAHMIPPTATMAFDLLTLPAMAKMMGKSTARNIGVAAKRHMGVPTTRVDKANVFIMDAIGAIDNLARKIKIPKKIVDYMSSYGASWSTGRKFGPGAGKIIEEISQVSPKYRKPLVDALYSAGDDTALKTMAEKDKTSIIEAVNAFNKTKSSWLLKKLKPEFGTGKTTIDPEKFPGYVKNIKDFEDSFIRAGAGTLGGIGVGLVGSTIGNNYRLKRLDSNLDQVASEETT